MSSLTRWVLAHKRTVILAWIVLTITGMAAAGPASKALDPKFSVPDKEGWETNVAIARHYLGTGGQSSPLVPVVTLPKGTTVASPGVRAELRRVDARLRRALPRARVASYASTGSEAFVSRDGRTTFALAYPTPDADSTFGENTAAEKRARAVLMGARVGGAPVHLTGFDALQQESGGGGGPGVLAEALLGAAGALIVLSFVFASFLAVVPLLMAVVSIPTTFLLLLGLTEVASISPIVQFLIALVGLGVSIDYSLLVVTRWREERAHGRSGDEAVQRAMETAGRAVVFSGITVAIGLLALIALPLPFLRSMGYGGMLIPLVSTLAAITLLPVVLATLGPRLDWPHRRTDERASRAWTRWAQAVTRRRWVAAGLGLAAVLALALAATDLRLAGSDADTVARSGDAKQGLVALERSGIGEGALLPHEILVAGATAPDRVAARVRNVTGIRGAVAPASASWRRDRTAIVEAIPVAASGSEAIWGIQATGSIPSWMPLMIFAFLFGLSMDYEVFILSRMREEYDRSGSTNAAVIRGIGRTGRLVTSAALILFLAFVSMASGPGTDLKMFATGLGAGILVDATVIRALIVPAVIAVMGRWNWWLPAWPARLLRVDPSLPRQATAGEAQ